MQIAESKQAKGNYLVISKMASVSEQTQIFDILFPFKRNKLILRVIKYFDIDCRYFFKVMGTNDKIRLLQIKS